PKKTPAFPRAFFFFRENRHNRACACGRILGGMTYVSLEVMIMPEKRTIKRARQKKRKGQSPSTQAGEFVREEIHHVRESCAEGNTFGRAKDPVKGDTTPSVGATLARDFARAQARTQ